MVNGERSGVNGLSQAAIGRAMDLSPAAVTKLKKLGMPVHSVEAALAWRTQRQNIAQRNPIPAPLLLAAPPAPAAAPTSVIHMPRSEPPATNDESQDQARTRREIAEANLAELKLAELRGALVRRETMEREVGTMAARLKDSVLQIKARLAPLLAAEGDVLKVSAMLDAELRAALDKGAA